MANKSFGWSRLFADLESLLPGGVSVSRISVEDIYKDGDQTKADLEFNVLSRNYQSVMTMIDNMNSSGIFQAELRGQDLQKTERLSLYGIQSASDLHAALQLRARRAGERCRAKRRQLKR